MRRQRHCFPGRHSLGTRARAETRSRSCSHTPSPGAASGPWSLSRSLQGGRVSGYSSPNQGPPLCFPSPLRPPPVGSMCPHPVSSCASVFVLLSRAFSQPLESVLPGHCRQFGPKNSYRTPEAGPSSADSLPQDVVWLEPHTTEPFRSAFAQHHKAPCDQPCPPRAPGQGAGRSVAGSRKPQGACAQRAFMTHLCSSSEVLTQGLPVPSGLFVLKPFTQNHGWRRRSS